ncbi:MAG TPA: hypothetical protein VKU38_21590 [Ktedonobacteraceae bacterium]|nr:hypothetical protein [Ktedonobacteraceae bacterium]
MSMHEPVPQITLHPNEIIVLESVVKGYLAFLRHGMPPSKKRDGQIRTLQRVQQHLIPLAHAQREQRYFPLTADEIQALDDALRSFVLLVRRMVPASRERDETLRDVENLRQQLAGIISPSTS